MIRSEATFVLNLDTATTNSYQTWVTVRLMGDWTLERKSNAGGNSQTWEVFGYVSENETKLFSTNANEAQAAKILGHFCYLAATRCNVKGYGAAWSKATWVRPTKSTQTGRKLTSAPSIRLGRVERDKNVKQRRWNGSLSDMIAARKSNGRTFAPRLVIDPLSLLVK